MTRRREAIIVAGAMLAATGWVIVASAALGPVARRMPLVVAIPTLLLLALELGREWRLARDRGGAEAAHHGAPPTSRRQSSERAMLGWLGILLALVVVAGMAAGVPLFLLAYMRVHFRESWRAALGLSGCVAILMTVGLEYLLGLPLHPGVIAGWLEAAR
jgi:hypothetical protein